MKACYMLSLMFVTIMLTSCGTDSGARQSSAGEDQAVLCINCTVSKGNPPSPPPGSRSLYSREGVSIHVASPILVGQVAVDSVNKHWDAGVMQVEVVLQGAYEGPLMVHPIWYDGIGRAIVQNFPQNQTIRLGPARRKSLVWRSPRPQGEGLVLEIGVIAEENDGSPSQSPASHKQNLDPIKKGAPKASKNTRSGSSSDFDSITDPEKRKTPDLDGL